MNNLFLTSIFPSFFLGLLFLALLFVASAVIVIGIKFTSIWLGKFFPKKQVEKPIVKPKPIKQKKPAKPIKSIEIDPDEVDRIYVKKIS